MTSWASLYNLATAAGTPVLAAAASSSIRSATRSTRAAGRRAVLAAPRPVPPPSRAEDRLEKVVWLDGHHVMPAGARAYPRDRVRASVTPHAPASDFRRQTRDLYVSAGDIGF